MSLNQNQMVCAGLVDKFLQATDLKEITWTCRMELGTWKYRATIGNDVVTVVVPPKLTMLKSVEIGTIRRGEERGFHDHYESRGTEEVDTAHELYLKIKKDGIIYFDPHSAVKFVESVPREQFP